MYRCIKVILAVLLVLGVKGSYADTVSYSYDLNGQVQTATFKSGDDTVTGQVGVGYDDANNMINYASGDESINYSDGDELDFATEIQRGTDPFSSDTDGDGLLDHEENAENGLDPLSSDSDGDGMPDKWELDNGLSPTNELDAAFDPDTDGLVNLDEFIHGTGINNRDSDNDTISDGDEVHIYGTNPLEKDTDFDGIPDLEELSFSRGIGMGLSHAAVAGESKVWWWGLDPLLNGTYDYHSVEVVKMENGDDFANAVQVETGTRFSMLLRKDGTVWGWGHNDSGQLGINVIETHSLSGEGDIVQVHGIGNVGMLQNIKEIAVGYDHVLALDESGNVYAWGANSYGQLGVNGAFTMRAGVPQRVCSPDGNSYLSGVRTIAAGAFHSVAVMLDGSVVSWGRNDYGQLGDQSIDKKALPVYVQGLTAVRDVGAGTYHTLAVQYNGTVCAWGRNSNGELGQGASSDLSLVPVQVLKSSQAGDVLTGIRAVDAGSKSSVALASDGTVWTWGNDGWGQLGNGSGNQNTAYYPVQVVGPDGTGVLGDVALISLVDEACLAGTRDGNVYMWGCTRLALDASGSGSENNSPKYLPYQIPNVTLGEIGWMTDPLNPDTDGDRMTDGWEIDHGFDPLNELDGLLDNDGDLLLNYYECLLETDPENSCTGDSTIADVDLDYDGDGMPNLWEILKGFDPIDEYDADYDYDSDGLTNVREYQFGTDPTQRDSDTDDLKDGDEVDIYGSSPLNPDTDGDFLEDGDEVLIHNTSPIKAHSDNDALTDYLEIMVYETNPLVEDSDTDGLSDREELTAWSVLSGSSESSVALTLGGDHNLQNVALSAEISGEDGKTARALENVNDGNKTEYDGYNGFGYTLCSEQGAMIMDLGVEYALETIKFLLYDKSSRYYKYTLEYSEDGVDGPWVMLVDHSNVKSKSWQTISCSSCPKTRYLKLTGLYNSANDGFHVVEWEVYASNPKLSAVTWGKGINSPLSHGVEYVENDDVVIQGWWHIRAGDGFLLGLKGDGTLLAWGKNEHGQLGIGSTSDSTLFVPVDNSDETGLLKGIKEVDVSWVMSLALDTNGRVYQWGGADSITLPVEISKDAWDENGIEYIAAGNDFALALDAAGTVWAWGNNDQNQLGQGVASGISSVPVKVKDTDGIDALSDIVEIVAGNHFAAALGGDGSVWMWGTGVSGEEPNVTTIFNYSLPVKVLDAQGVPLSYVKTLSADGSHCLALTFDGLVWSWGDNTSKQLGYNSDEDYQLTPQLVMIEEEVGEETEEVLLDDVEVIQATPGGAMVVRDDGSVWMWGRNDLGQCGRFDDNDDLITGDPCVLPGQVNDLECDIIKSLPTESDTDLDGIPDGWERDNKLRHDVVNAGFDDDEDAFSNIEEYHRSTDPQDPLSRPAYVEINPDGCSPEESELTAVEESTLEFEVSAFARYGHDVTYAWYLDNNPVEDALAAMWGWEIDDTLGGDSYAVRCDATANGDTASVVWQVAVENTNHAPVITVEEKTCRVGEACIFENDVDYYDPDNKNAVANDDNEMTVSFDGGWITENGQVIVPGDADETPYDVTLHVCDDGDPEACSSKDVQVHVIGPDLKPGTGVGWSMPLIICSEQDPETEVDQLECGSTYYIYVAEECEGSSYAEPHSISVYLDEEELAVIERNETMQPGDMWVLDTPVGFDTGERGEHAIHVYIDSNKSMDENGDVHEVNEGNNTFSRTVQARGEFSFSCSDADKVVIEEEAVTFEASIPVSQAGGDIVYEWLLDGVAQPGAVDAVWEWQTDSDSSLEELRCTRSVTCNVQADGGSASYTWSLSIVNSNHPIVFDESLSEVSVYANRTLELPVSYTDADDNNQSLVDDSNPRYVVSEINGWIESLTRQITMDDVSDDPYEVTVCVYDGGVPEKTDSKKINVTVLPFPDVNENGMDDEWESLYNLNDPENDTDGDLNHNTDDDPDSDGLTNYEEFIAHTRPDLYDTDDDGLNDKLEVIIYETNPNEPDTDGDGQDDLIEVQNLTDPNNIASFTTSISGSVSYTSGWQVQQSGNVVVVLQNSDYLEILTLPQPGTFSFDGIHTLDAYYLYAFVDADGDEWWDNNEAGGWINDQRIYLTESLLNVSLVIHDVDSDEDGLPNWVEDDSGTYVSDTRTGTNPNDADCDDDGMFDADEVENIALGYNPFNPDVDLDGWPDGYEYHVLNDINAALDLETVPPGNHVVNGDFESIGSWNNMGLYGETEEEEVIFATGRSYGGYEGSICAFYRMYMEVVMPRSYPVFQTSTVLTNVNYLLSFYRYTIDLEGYSGVDLLFFNSENVDTTKRDEVVNAKKQVCSSCYSPYDGKWLKYIESCPVNEYALSNEFDSVGIFLSMFNHDGQSFQITDGITAWDNISLAIDYDNDLMPDYWEVAHGLNPTINDADDDPDGDFFSNSQEFLDDTDPQSQESHYKEVGVKILSPTADERFTASTDIHIKAAAYDESYAHMDSVEFYNGSQTEPLGTDDEFPFEFVWENVEPGTYLITAVGYKDGVPVTSDPVSITVQHPPVVTILSPENGAVYELYDDVTIDVLATDVEDGELELKLLFLNDMFRGILPSDEENTLQLNSPGACSMYIATIDSDGAYGVSERVTFDVNVPPIITTMSVDVVEETDPGSLEYVVEAYDYEDSENDVSLSLKLYLDDALEDSISGSQMSGTLNDLAEGTHEIYAEVEDSKGFKTKSDVVTFDISEPPTIEISGITDHQVLHDPDSIEFDVSMANAGDIASIEYYVDGFSIGHIDLPDTSITWVAIDIGRHHVYAKAYDADGVEVGISEMVEFTINSRPEVTLLPPEGSVSVSDEVVLTAVAEDLDGSISRVEFYIDDVKVKTNTTSPYQYTWTVPDAEVHYLKAIAYDSDGGTDVSEIIFSANDAPTVIITAPDNDDLLLQSVESTSIEVMAYDSDGVQDVRFYANNELMGIDAEAPYSWDWGDIAPGVYQVTAKLVDSLGASVESAPRIVTVNASPSAIVHQPLDGQVFQDGETVMFSVEASDADDAVSVVSVYDGVDLLGAVTETDVDGRYCLEWNNPSVGTHSVSVNVQDQREGTYVSSQMQIVVNESPIVTLVSMDEPVVIKEGDSYLLQAQASDNDDRVDHLVFHVDGLENDYEFDAVSNGETYEYEWKEILADTYTVSAAAYDTRGGVTEVVGTLIADALPSIQILSPEADTVVNAPGSIDVNIEATDADGTIASMQIYRNDVLVENVNASIYAVTWDDMEAGWYDLKVVAEDNHGFTTTEEVGFLVNAAPSVQIISPDTESVIMYGQKFMIHVTASDLEDGTVEDVRCYYDGNLLLESEASSGVNHYYYKVPVESGVDKTITAQAVDRNGRIAEAEPVVVHVNKAPTVNITAPEDNMVRNPADASCSITVEAEDDDAGDAVTKVDLYVNGMLFGSDDTAPYEWEWTSDEPGAYVMTAVAYDTYDVKKESADVCYIVNDTPIVEFKNPVLERDYSTPASIELDVDVRNVGDAINTVTLYVNGAPYYTWTERPYQMTLDLGTIGDYALSVVAEDENGLSGNSETVIVHIVAYEDEDNDGIGKAEEVYDYGTNPDVWDTDKDGAPDGWEVENGYDPAVAEYELLQDLDNDGMIAGEELWRGLNPNVFNTFYGVTLVDTFDEKPTLLDMNKSYSLLLEIEGQPYLYQHGAYTEVDENAKVLNSHDDYAGKECVNINGELVTIPDFYASDINDDGIVVGYEYDDNMFYAAMYEGGELSRIGNMSGIAYAINNDGDVVGNDWEYGCGFYKSHEYVSIQKTEPYDLMDINNAGDALVWWYVEDNAYSLKIFNGEQFVEKGRVPYDPEYMGNELMFLSDRGLISFNIHYHWNDLGYLEYGYISYIFEDGVGAELKQLVLTGELDDVVIEDVEMNDAGELYVLVRDDNVYQLLMLSGKNVDNDGDEITDYDEYQSEFALYDSDQDGWLNGWELEHGFDPYVNDDLVDEDGDGLSTVQEYLYETSVTDDDTDDDGMNDGDEVLKGADPLVVNHWYKLLIFDHLVEDDSKIWVTDVNNAGIVVGNLDGHSFVYDGSFEFIMPDADHSSIYVYQITDDNTIIGTCHNIVDWNDEWDNVAPFIYKNGNKTFASGFNADAEVVGFVDYIDETTACGVSWGRDERFQYYEHAYWYPHDDRSYICQNGVFTEIPKDGYLYSRTKGINRQRHVVGSVSNYDYMFDHSGVTRAYRYEDGVMSLIPLPDGYDTSSALAINDNELVVGSCSGADVGGALFMADTDNQITVIEANQFIALNNSGLILCSKVMDDGFTHACIYDAETETMTDLQTLGRKTFPRGLNEHGYAVGDLEYDIDVDERTRDGSGFFYHDGQTDDLASLLCDGELPVGYYIIPTSINDGGYIKAELHDESLDVEYCYSMDAVLSPLDSDEDGVGNALELLVYDTDPYCNDSDNDGILDGEEIFGVTLLSSSGEGSSETEMTISDDYGSELSFTCAWIPPYIEDSDGDGWSDDWEEEHGYDPDRDDRIADDDDDTLSNKLEYEMETDHTNPDTDHDGWNDNLDPDPRSQAVIDFGSADNYSDRLMIDPYWPVWMEKMTHCAVGTWDTSRSAYVVPSSAPTYAGTPTLFVKADEINGRNMNLSFKVDPYAFGSLYVQLRDGDWNNLVNNYSGIISTYNLRSAEGNVSLNLPMQNIEIVRMHRYYGSVTWEEALLFIDDNNDGIDDTQMDAVIAARTEGKYGLDNDHDGDGLDDYDEHLCGLDFTNSDEDGNGLRDDEDDFDKDGLNNREEIVANTNPFNDDTDGDGMSDGDEVDAGRDPTEADTIAGDDSDNDGLLDDVELSDAYGTDPFNADTDGDGWIDGLDPDPRSQAIIDFGSIDHYSDRVMDNPYWPVWMDEMTHDAAGTWDASRSAYVVPTSAQNYAGTPNLFVNPDVINGRNMNLSFKVDPDASGCIYIQLRDSDWNNLVNNYSGIIGTYNLRSTHGNYSVNLPMQNIGIVRLHRYYGAVTWEEARLFIDNNNDGIDDTQMDAVEAARAEGKYNSDNDHDQDGLDDYDEKEHHMDFTCADENGNGVLDGDEFDLSGGGETGFSPGPADADGDGLDDAYEWANNLNPLNPDTDGDGIEDGDEVSIYGTDPVARDELDYWYVAPGDFPRKASFAAGTQFNPLTSIQDALSRVHEGDTVHVYPGVYHEAVSIPCYRCTLKGTDTEEVDGIMLPAAIIDASGLGQSGITIGSKHDITIENIWVKGADGNNESSGTDIAISGGQNVVLDHVVTEDSDAYCGIIAFFVDQLTIRNSIVRNNGREGIKLFCCVGGSVEDTVFEGNVLTGCTLWESAGMTVQNNRILNNSGSGMTVYGSDEYPAGNTLIIGNEVSGNQSGLSLWGRVEEVSVVLNDIIDNQEMGVRVPSAGAVLGSLKYNNIWQESGYLIYAGEDATILDASANYYGSSAVFTFMSRFSGDYEWRPFSICKYDIQSRAIDSECDGVSDVSNLDGALSSTVPGDTDGDGFYDDSLLMSWLDMESNIAEPHKVSDPDRGLVVWKIVEDADIGEVLPNQGPDGSDCLEFSVSEEDVASPYVLYVTMLRELFGDELPEPGSCYRVSFDARAATEGVRIRTYWHINGYYYDTAEGTQSYHCYFNPAPYLSMSTEWKTYSEVFYFPEDDTFSGWNSTEENAQSFCCRLDLCDEGVYQIDNVKIEKITPVNQ